MCCRCCFFDIAAGFRPSIFVWRNSFESHHRRPVFIHHDFVTLSVTEKKFCAGTLTRATAKSTAVIRFGRTMFDAVFLAKKVFSVMFECARKAAPKCMHAHVRAGSAVQAFQLKGVLLCTFRCPLRVRRCRPTRESGNYSSRNCATCAFLQYRRDFVRDQATFRRQRSRFLRLIFRNSMLAQFCPI